VKRLTIPFAHVAAALLIGTLAACGSWPGHKPAPGTSAASGGAEGYGTSYGAGRVAIGDMTGDRQAVCELNRRLTAARTPEARQAVIDKYMGTMSPETRHHYLQMMRDQCQ